MSEESCLMVGCEGKARRCHIFGGRDAEVCIICGMEEHAEREITETARQFYEADEAAACRLIVFETADWNGDFSPWPSGAVFGGSPFVGRAPETLMWVTGTLLPYLEKEAFISAEGKKYLAGYSLAGLFALWAFLESGVFDGAASCSGSLWFPGWMDYMENHRRERSGIVYLSLGSREEKTGNTCMARVGDNTRDSYRLFACNAAVTGSVLEWNRGGHFTDPMGRLVRGMLWLLREEKDMQETQRHPELIL